MLLAALRVAGLESHAYAERGDVAHGKRSSSRTARFLNDLQLRLLWRHALGQGRHQRLGAFAHRFGIFGEHAQRGDAAKRILGVQIQAKRGLKGGERHLVQAQRAGERMLLQAVDVFLAAHHDAGLRAAEQLIA